METSAISFRVADFLKKHPPFQSMEESDLLELAARGRVKFHEPNEYILWQGEPHRHQVFVIQQGTVSLWDEAASDAELRDVRGVGDMLGVEQFNGAQACVHSARSSSDVLIYAFPAYEFEMLLDKYPTARQHVMAYGSVVTDYQWTDASAIHGRRSCTMSWRRTLCTQSPSRRASLTSRKHRCRPAPARLSRRFCRPGTRAVTPDSLMAWIATGEAIPGRRQRR